MALGGVRSSALRLLARCLVLARAVGALCSGSTFFAVRPEQSVFLGTYRATASLHVDPRSDRTSNGACATHPAVRAGAQISESSWFSGAFGPNHTTFPAFLELPPLVRPPTRAVNLTARGLMRGHRAPNAAARPARQQ